MNRTGFLSCLGALSIFAAGTAAAAPGADGPDLGLRLGYGLPLGSSVKNTTMSDYVTGQVPIQVDAGYRFTPNIMAGLYFSYGFLGVADKACPSPADCSAHDMRLGLQAQYRLSPGESVNPWFGLGFGLEWLGVSQSGGGAETKATGSGFEFLDLQGGADFKVAEGLGVGPFLSFSLGQYNSSSVSCSGLPPGLACPAGGDIKDKALHEWLMFGARGVFEL